MNSSVGLTQFDILYNTLAMSIHCWIDVNDRKAYFCLDLGIRISPIKAVWAVNRYHQNPCIKLLKILIGPVDKEDYSSNQN